MKQSCNYAVCVLIIFLWMIIVHIGIIVLNLI